uniref:Uncharacterized protein n=1 Tax=Athene cunicularia TaxID=194338 RepID=A0A663N1F4_ATHCN
MWGPIAAPPLSLGDNWTVSDFSGQLLAYLSLGPIFIIVGFVTLIIFKRELHTVSPSLPSQLLLMTEVFLLGCAFFELLRQKRDAK